MNKLLEFADYRTPPDRGMIAAQNIADEKYLIPFLLILVKKLAAQKMIFFYSCLANFEASIAKHNTKNCRPLFANLIQKNYLGPSFIAFVNILYEKNSINSYWY